MFEHGFAGSQSNKNVASYVRTIKVKHAVAHKGHIELGAIGNVQSRPVTASDASHQGNGGDGGAHEKERRRSSRRPG